MKRNIVKKSLSFSCLMIIIFIFILSNFSSVFALSKALIDTSMTASLTIVKYENAHGVGKDPNTNVALKDVEFTIYRLKTEDEEKSVEELETGIKDGSITALETKSMTTGSNGTVKFDTLTLGRYLVIETKIPKNVSIKMDSFLIDLPRSNETGTEWDYDITVYPKNETVYGDVTLNKFDTDNISPLENTVWELQVKKDGEYVKYDYDGELTTNSEGKITVSGLPVGDYRLVEIKTLDGYILDQSNVQEFTVTAENTTFTKQAINEKLDIEKEVKGDIGYTEHIGAYETDTVNWKITTDVPTIITKLKNYYVTDNLPVGTTYKENSIVAKGVTDSEEKDLTLDTDYTVSCKGQELKVNFDSSKLEGLKQIYFTYDTTFNDEITYNTALENTATLTYTNKINVDGTATEDVYTTKEDSAEVHVGKVLIKKEDKEGNPLSGAKFKISSTEDNANNEVYIKGKDGEDLVATSDDEGKVIFEGLKYGADGSTTEEGESYYYVTEIESPTYEDENGEIKHYNLLAKPIEVVVNSHTHEIGEDTVTIVNKKGFVLPKTGAIGLGLLGIILIGIAIKLNKKENV